MGDAAGVEVEYRATIALDPSDTDAHSTSNLGLLLAMAPAVGGPGAAAESATERSAAPAVVV